MKPDTFRFLAGALLPIGGLPSQWGWVLRPYPVEAPDTPPHYALALAEARTELMPHEPVQTTG